LCRNQAQPTGTKMNDRFRGGATAIVYRVVPMFALLLLSIGASADDCFSLYAKSGATQGSPTCKLDVTSNTPGGMGNYACINDLALIDQWCNATVNPSDDSCPVADPVFPANGNVALFETDFASGDADPLVFSRSYLSKPYDKAQTSMGGYWTNNWQRRLDLTSVKASTPKIAAYRGNGQPLTFRLSAGAWVVPGTPGLSLRDGGDGYFYLKDELRGTTETYSTTTGIFNSETTRTGMYREVEYDGQRRVAAIVQWPVDRVGQIPSRTTLSLTYDSNGRVSSVVTPSGDSTHYAYDSRGNLVSLTRPDAYVRQYLYEDARFPNALTGLKDESGSRTATWAYDSSGRATSVTHPDTTRNVSLSYLSGTTTLNDMSGTSMYSFDVGDTSRPRSIATPGGIVSRTWDAAGNLKQRQTPDGGVQYNWDSANRPTRAVATASGTKTVTTIEYNDDQSLRPHLVATPEKIRAFVYDSGGHVTGYAEVQTTDQTGEQGMQAVGTGSKMTVSASYDGAGRLASATVTQDGTKTQDWTYAYDARGDIAVAQDGVSGWTMRTLGRDAANRATQIAGNSGQASIAYDERGRVKSFQYNEPASAVNGGVARVLAVGYRYAPDGTLSSRTAKVSTNGAWWQPISDAELGVWLTNWELGNDPVAPAPSQTGLKSDGGTFVPDICVECYMSWKAEFTGKLYHDEVSDVLPMWGETSELMLSDQSQVPYPALVPDVTGSAKRAMLYSSLFKGGGGDGGMVKCGGRAEHEAKCFAQYEYQQDLCTTLAGPRKNSRLLALCRQTAFENYQTCLGY
jgi:YD repeat-containing protein